MILIRIANADPGLGESYQCGADPVELGELTDDKRSDSRCKCLIFSIFEVSEFLYF
jgi:hypothetical protein